MKIFSNFDTELDEKIFLSKLNEYWNGNVLLVKRHPLFLYKVFFYGIFAIWIFVILTYLLYTQYYSEFFFYFFFIWNLLWIWVWIFLLFKKFFFNLINYKEFISCKEDFDKIALSWFWWFLKYSFLLFFYQFILSIINICILYNNGWENIAKLWLLSIIVLNILFLCTMVKIIQRFIDFEMDFIIVTKDEIELIDQVGIFRRKVISLALQKVKTITIDKDWFFKSIFNIGSLKILSEWDSEGNGEIRLNYIHRLWFLKRAIMRLINQNWYSKNDNS